MLSNARAKRRGSALIGAAAALAGAAVWGPAEPSRASVIIFSDTFGSSTLNGTSTPSSSSTSYDIASAKNATSTIASGDLHIVQPATTSGITEAQAIFTASPVSLTSPRENVELTVTFTDGANLTTGGTASPIYFGLYESSGSVPYTTLQSTGLTSSSTMYATGGVAGWQGYVSQIAPSGGTSKIVTRPVQSGTTNVNQDLVSNAASSSQSYTGGVTLASGSTGTTTTLSNGTQYTEDLLITLTATNTYSIASNLYSGAAVSGTPLATQTATGVTSTNFFNGFDGLAIGSRNAGTSQATTLDVNSITVSDSVPEPASLGILGAGMLLGLCRRRRGVPVV